MQSNIDLDQKWFSPFYTKIMQWNVLISELILIFFSLSGPYVCHVRNEAGDNEFTYDIIVHDPLKFEDATLNQTIVKVDLGTIFSTDCKVTGYPTPNVCIYATISIELATYGIKL